jgi:hypothetical protein
MHFFFWLFFKFFSGNAGFEAETCSCVSVSGVLLSRSAGVARLCPVFSLLRSVRQA